jgi:histidinol-phosphatase
LDTLDRPHRTRCRRTARDQRRPEPHRGEHRHLAPPARLSPPHTALAARVAAAARTTRPTLNWADPAPTPGAIRKPSTGTGTCHGALLVATGQLDAFLLLGAGPWDIAPLIPIIEEAGGSYDDLTMDPSTGTVSALFTNHALRHQILNATNHSF